MAAASVAEVISEGRSLSCRGYEGRPQPPQPKLQGLWGWEAASLIATAGVPHSLCSLVQMEEMVFMAVINFKVLPAASAAASAAAAAANSIYNCHMMAMAPSKQQAATLAMRATHHCSLQRCQTLNGSELPELCSALYTYILHGNTHIPSLAP